MRRRTRYLLVGLGTIVAGVGLYRAASRTDVETVPYTVVDTVGDVEIRRYPTTVTVETTAPSTGAAFSRLYDYITGANRTATAVEMTAPVATESAGESVAMTAPVATDRTDAGVRMSFFLPAEYDYESAPRPTDPAVSLVEHPERTLAVLRFSWYATDRRTRKKVGELRAALETAPVSVVGDPFVMQYDPPTTPPFLRTNEVAVEVRRRTSGST